MTPGRLDDTGARVSYSESRFSSGITSFARHNSIVQHALFTDESTDCAVEIIVIDFQ